MIWRGCLAGLFFFIYSSCVFALERLDSKRQYLGTTVSTTVCYADDRRQEAEAVLAAVWTKFADAQMHMNTFDALSDVSILNRSLGKVVVVSDDVYDLIAISKNFKVITGGVFDVSVGPLFDLWKSSAVKNVWPSLEDVHRSKALVDAERVELLGHNRVRIPSSMKIDLGGNAAGYLADRAAKILRGAGFDNFLIDAGGEIYAGGVSCEGRGWHVGIRDPGHMDQARDVLQLEDAAVSTSGGYARFMTIKNERWSYIINPVTGFPVRDVVSATVVAPTALEADILSTTLVVLGQREGFRFIDSLGSGYAAMMLLHEKDGLLQEHRTQGYNKFLFK